MLRVRPFPEDELEELGPCPEDELEELVCVELRGLEEVYVVLGVGLNGLPRRLTSGSPE